MFASFTLNDAKQTEELVGILTGIEAICHKSITKRDIILNIYHLASINHHPERTIWAFLL